MVMSHVVVGVSLFLAVGLAEHAPRTLSVQDAQALVIAGAPRAARHLPGLYADGGRVVEKGRCMPFDLIWANPGPGSAHIEFYTVDLQTGALWSGINPKLVTTPRLGRLQRKLRKRLGIKTVDYRRAVKAHVCSE
jgi:hypothetical protein